MLCFPPQQSEPDIKPYIGRSLAALALSMSGDLEVSGFGAAAKVVLPPLLLLQHHYPKAFFG